MKALLAAAALLLAVPALAQDDPALAAARALQQQAMVDPTAWSLLSSLTTDVGARRAGSEAAARARDWGLAQLRALGFINVHAEAYPIRYWRRGEERAELTAPYSRPLNILGLGRSVPTPPGGIEAEVVVFDSYDEMLRASSLAGRIVLVNQPMVRTQDASGYGAINRNRTQGAGEAARRGAVAYLVRSLATDEANNPHTGAMNYPAGVLQIPAAAISVPDANVLAGLARRGGARVRLVLASETVDSQAYDVVGEFVGRERPDEVVVIGGHLDSWDVGTGAVDDGAGVAITTAAARLVGAKGPRRTIRVVMWGSEEMADSGARYARDHAAEAPKIVAASESDNGSGAVFAFALPPNGRGRPELASLASALAPLKTSLLAQGATSSGSDTAGLHQLGVPAFSFDQDASKYFDLHHSRNDTLEQVDRRELDQNVAAWATVLHYLANTGVDFRSPPSAPLR